MDISLSSVAPRSVADRRPVADAAATARPARHPTEGWPAPRIEPTSFVQEGLVTQGFMESAGLVPVGAASDTQFDSHGGPQRVLKPWGVPMLPEMDECDPGASQAGEVQAASEPSLQEQAEIDAP